MDIDYYATYFAFEKDDWWFAGRRAIVLGFVREALAGREREALRLVDAGSGTGITMTHLQQLGPTVGVDFSPEAIRFCRMRGLEQLVNADVCATGLAADTFDVVSCLDVIEHVPDDVAAVRELYRICKPGGTLVLTVPALPFLWSEHDVINHHRRRYRRQRIETLMREAGFEVERLSYYNFWLSPLATGLRLLKRVWTNLCPQVVQRIEADNTYLPRSINWLFTRIFASEGALLRHTNLPYGISLICIARKPA